MTIKHQLPHVKDIKSRIQTFNVIALLKRLIALGYPKESIFFVSNDSYASSKSQIEKVDFEVTKFLIVTEKENLEAESLRGIVSENLHAKNKYIFDLGEVYSKNLNENSITVKLQEEFLFYGYPLSQGAFVKKNSDKSWTILDPENKHQYYIEQDQYTLNIYTQLYLIQVSQSVWLANYESVYFVSIQNQKQIVMYQHRQVNITINMGFFGSTGLLPTYFSKLMDHYDIQGPKFKKFISFFDNQMIKNYLSTIYPEYYRELFYNNTTFSKYAIQNWSTYQHVTLQMLPTCIGTLHWLFSSVYPELGVKIEKHNVNQKTNTKSEMGATTLGHTALSGCETVVSTFGFRIQLYADTFNCTTGRLWPKEILKRLYESIFYALEGITVGLLVQFVICVTPSTPKLKGAYLGLSELPSLLFTVPIVTISDYMNKGKIPDFFRDMWAKRGLAFSEQMEITIVQANKKWQLQDSVSKYDVQLNDQHEISIFENQNLLFTIENDYFYYSLNNGFLPQEMATLLEKYNDPHDAAISCLDNNIWQIYFGNDMYIIAKEQNAYGIYKNYEKTKVVTVYEGLPDLAKPTSD